MRYFLFILSSLLIFACQETSTDQDTSTYTNWDNYLGDKESSHYSPLTQINKDNVQQLELLWTYDAGDADTIKDRTQIQCNPLVIDGVLYGSSPRLKFFALDAATGEQKWLFDPYADDAYEAFGMGVNRGLAYWTDGTEKRLLFTASDQLYSIDAKTGELDPDFGNQGQVDLHEGLGRPVDDLFINSNSPGIVYQDKLILGSRVSESSGPIPGHIRAYDVRTGEMDWIFHTIPHPDEFGYDTWPEDAWQYSGGANAWAGFSLDEERGIVYAPTGSASFDFYGGDRIGDNLFANSLLALDAKTGERIWHFQTVHHDLWDRDLPAPPTLVQVEKDGKQVDAVAQITKSALIFLFDRETGEPLFPIEERPVLASDLEGEMAATTQPIPTKPLPFARTTMEKKDITRRTPEAYDYVYNIWKDLKKGEYFVPPSVEGSLAFPGFDGGGEWGGSAFDPETDNLIINASEMPVIIKMNLYEQVNVSPALASYQVHCQACHGKNMEGGSAFGGVPAIADAGDRLDKATVKKILVNGKGAMPGFGHLEDAQIDALSDYILGEEMGAATHKNEIKTDWDYPYTFDGYTRFKDHEGYPAITPPWGTLNAVNLSTGELSWKITLGERDGELLGTESYGGPVVTAGGLIFIAATSDSKFRVFDKDNGELLWETDLPAPGFATPAVYAIDGKQYVVIAAGGGKLGKRSGGQYLAFGLGE
ncbi:MAG: pyrroloquinoline quinone-dependent dehydrogenase [Bacteroidota bacterium]